MLDIHLGNKIFSIVKILVLLYAIICILLYLFQEKIIFFPQKLARNYHFNFSGNFKEMYIITKDNKSLHGILFKADSSKGLVFYLHGNAGSLATWGEVAKTYTALNYDIFILDYRGYGKSEGTIKNQNQLHSDIQQAYNEIIKLYNEQNIVILGYSIGTGLASKLAAENNPKCIILQAPYYSLKDMMRKTFRILPTFILKYKLSNFDNLKQCQMPIFIFHGDKDEVIYYGSSLKLKEELSNLQLITLKDMGHNGMTENVDYLSALKNILNSK